jgi:hypothetical protein
LATSLNLSQFGELASVLLAGEGENEHLQHLVRPTPANGSDVARESLKSHSAQQIFPHAFAPRAALTGLWIYLGEMEAAHALAQDDASSEGSYWHAIIHRLEPDPSNSAYWFRRVGKHPIYPDLRDAAEAILRDERGTGFRLGSSWDPFHFIDFCMSASEKPVGSSEHRTALALQRAEWQLLFVYCARQS